MSLAGLSGSRRQSVTGNPLAGIFPALIFLILFFAIPIAVTLARSFFPAGADGPSLANYVAFFSSRTLTDAAQRSLILALSTVTVASLLAWPTAYFLAFVVPPRWRAPALLLLVAPFWTSFAIRAFSWQLVLSDSGLLAFAIEALTGRRVQLGFLYSFYASVFGLALFGAMLMTLMLYSTMIAIERRLVEASAALGGGPWATFVEVIAPLSMPGWITGALLTFIIATGDYAVPTLLGGGFKPVLAQVMISTLKGTYDVSLAATLAVVLIAIVALSAGLLALLVRKSPAGSLPR